MPNEDVRKMRASQESYENSAKAIINAREYNTAIDEAVKDYFDREGYDSLKGKGRPIHYEEGDPLQIVLKAANFKPPWIELRHEIVKDMEAVIAIIDRHGKNASIEQQVEDINIKIRRLNRVVPHPHFQRGLLTIDNIKAKYELWL